MNLEGSRGSRDGFQANRESVLFIIGKLSLWEWWHVLKLAKNKDLIKVCLSELSLILLVP